MPGEWDRALAALIELLEGVDGVDAVLRTPAVSAAEVGRESTVVALTPAGHTTSRLGGGDRTRTWSQSMVVLRHIGGAQRSQVAAAIDAVTAATLAIDDALDGRLTLGGAATVAGPLTWGEGEAYEIPEGSAQLYAGQTGACDIIIVSPGPRGA